MLKFMGKLSVALLSMAWSGYVLSILWGWFIVPFFLLPSLPIAYAIGLRLIALSFARVSAKDVDNNDEVKDSYMKTVVIAVLLPAYCLFFGWVVTLFI